MNSKSSLSYIIFLFLVLAVFILNKILLNYFYFQAKEFLFQVPLYQVYFFFTISTFSILFILNIAKRKYFDSLGYIFIALTSIKMGLSIYWFNVLLYPQTPMQKIEKTNFFIVFALFLIAETILSIRILNKKP